jgi:hypothetical protein
LNELDALDCRTEDKREYGGTRPRWEDNRINNLLEMGFGCPYWIDLA